MSICQTYVWHVIQPFMKLWRKIKFNNQTYVYLLDMFSQKFWFIAELFLNSFVNGIFKVELMFPSLLRLLVETGITRLNSGELWSISGVIFIFFALFCHDKCQYCTSNALLIHQTFKFFCVYAYLSTARWDVQVSIRNWNEIFVFLFNFWCINMKILNLNGL